MSKNVKKPQIPLRYRQQQVQQNGTNTGPVNTSNGMQQFRVPKTPFMDVPATPPTTIPAIPYPWAAPVIVDPRKQERVERYAQWLSANNSLPVSPQKLQVYQDASLEIKQIGKRDVRTFAPFQERTSALQVITSDQLTIFSMLAVYWIVGLVLLHLAMFTITLSIVTMLYICGFVVSGILATKSFNGSSGEKIDEEIIAALDQRGVEWPTYTILCPLYEESAIVPQFVEAIKSLNYPAEKLQVLFLTEEDDHETRAALYSMRLPRGFTILTVPKGSPQTKPRACNFGLLQAKGQFIVIFDAEDKPEPYQLKKAVLAFANLGPEVACVQAKLNYYNSTQNLLTRWFTAEYSTWFDIMLPGLQQSGFSLPLGGTSNHFRTEVLRALGGWDAFNVTEDCDLGLRISQYGLKTAVLDSTTYEEATSRVKSWLFQRSRWIKGYLQTYLVHMRHPVQTLRRGQSRKFFSLQLIVGAWTVVLLINPFMWALTALYLVFRPVQFYSILFPGPILYMGAFCLIFGNFFYVYIHLIGCVRRKEYALIKWVLLIPLYWVMMSMSAYIAFYQLIVKPHYWEKTQHGNHLAPAAQAQAQRLAPAIGQDGRAVVVSMPTTRLFAVTVGRIFKQAATVDELGTTTQRVKAVRGTLSTRLGQRKVRRQMHRPGTRDLWLVATIIVACITSIIACWYYFQQHEILLYGDSLQHMRLARMVFDSATPGLAQLGGVWLPLPHIFMWPFIWNDYLWHTGLAGSFAAMPCYVIAAIYLFLSARRLTRKSAISFIGVLVLLLNPNILYLQTTPLSDVICVAMFTASGYYFLAWAQEGKLKQLVLAAACTFLATLARYDGWALFLVLLILVPLISWLRGDRWKQIQGNIITFGVLGGLGIALWLAWCGIILGDPLYFQHGPFSAGTQQLGPLHNGTLYTYHNLSQSIKFYLVLSMETVGFLLFALAVLAVIIFVSSKIFAFHKDKKRAELAVMLATLAFLAPFVFYVVSLYTGQAIIWTPGAVPANAPNQFFNVRYGVQTVAPAALFLVLLADVVLVRLKARASILCHILFVIIILAQSVYINYTGIVSLEAGLTGLDCAPISSIDLYFAEHYDSGRILVDTFNSNFNEAEDGIDLKNIIYDGSGELWHQALHDPASVVDWVVANPGDLVSTQLDTTNPAFLQQFTPVVSSSSFHLYHKKGLPPIPTRNLPPNFLSEHRACGATNRP